MSAFEAINQAAGEGAETVAVIFRDRKPISEAEERTVRAAGFYAGMAARYNESAAKIQEVKQLANPFTRDLEERVLALENHRRALAASAQADVMNRHQVEQAELYREETTRR